MAFRFVLSTDALGSAETPTLFVHMLPSIPREVWPLECAFLGLRVWGFGFSFIPFESASKGNGIKFNSLNFAFRWAVPIRAPFRDQRSLRDTIQKGLSWGMGFCTPHFCILSYFWVLVNLDCFACSPAGTEGPLECPKPLNTP